MLLKYICLFELFDLHLAKKSEWDKEKNKI
jgi:hypothetical protein